MLRHNAHPPATSSTPLPIESRGVAAVRQGAAARGAAYLRVALAPIALLFAALGGAVFAILLPICGIATIAEGIARGAWAFVRGAMPQTLSRSATRN